MEETVVIAMTFFAKTVEENLIQTKILNVLFVRLNTNNHFPVVTGQAIEACLWRIDALETTVRTKDW